MPITALLELQVKPQDAPTAPALIDNVLIATRAFTGCLGVDVVVDVEDPAHFMVIERWESLDADAAYRAWRATPAGASDLGSILAAAPTLTRFSSAVGG